MSRRRCVSAGSGACEIGVRCGGHSVLGICVPDGGLMIDLSTMHTVRVDPDAGRAWVQGGAQLGALDRSAQRFGLATTAGNISYTGVGGLTLGGGMGWLARRFGLACDNVEAFEVVTADGLDGARQCIGEQRPVLGPARWRRQLRCRDRVRVPTPPHRHGGTDRQLLLQPRRGTCCSAPMARPARRRAAQATLTAWVGTSGEWPFLPRELHNRPLASAGLVWVGDPDEGKRLLPVFSDLAGRVAENADEMTYLELQSIDDDGHRHGLRRRYWKGHYLPQLPDAAIDAFLSQGMPEGDGIGDRSMLPAASFQSYGGAIASLSDDESAFSHRDTMVEFVAAAGWTDLAEDEQRIAAAGRFGAAMEPFASGVYVNVLGDEGEEGVRRAYRPDKLVRLAALKHRYDPENVFHLNHNIRPVPGSAS